MPTDNYSYRGIAQSCESLGAFLRQAAAAYGDRPAISHLDASLTYTQLLDYASGFAAHIQAKSVAPGTAVVLAVENSLDYTVCLFGSILAGLVVVPVNADTTRESLTKIVSHSLACGVITRKRTVARLNLADVPALAILEDGFGENAAALYAGPTVPDAPAAANDVSMILYTSGTTGDPKGVMLTHRNMLANASSIARHLKLTAEDKIVNVLPLFHSFGNMVLLSHIDVGASIVLENRFAFPNTVVATMQRERPTGFSGVPATFYILLSRSDFPKLDWSFLRYVNSGGGGLRVSVVRQLRELLPHTDICITYGQTEASARLAYLPPEMLDAKIGAIGIPAPGIKLRVVNERGEDVRVGETGEIVAQGPNVMPGYFRNPESTRAALRDGWLYTGDIARIDEDGYIFIVSRKSDFIKSAAYRISPAEIEEVVAEVGGIEDSAAFGVEDELVGESIAVCVICDKSGFSAERIRNHCISRLPFYKVPKYIIHDPDIPRTPSGKKRYFLLREKYRAIGGRQTVSG